METKSEKDSSKIIGGIARAKALSKERKSEIAKTAAQARWGNELPRAIVGGELIIAGRQIGCAVLETGKRLLTQETFLIAIGRSARPKGGTGVMSFDELPPFLA